MACFGALAWARSSHGRLRGAGYRRLLSECKDAQKGSILSTAKRHIYVHVDLDDRSRGGAWVLVSSQANLPGDTLYNRLAVLALGDSTSRFNGARM